MRHLWHLWRYGTRAQSLALLAFGGMLVCEAAFTLFVADSADQQVPSVFRFPWWPAARAALAGLLAARIVQQDPLVGTTAFWRTRPISRLQLCLSKGLLLACWLVLLPAATVGLTWIRVGIPWHTVLWVAGSAAVEQLIVVLVVVLAAVVTSSLTQLTVACVAGMTAAVVLDGVAAKVLQTRLPEFLATLPPYDSTVFLVVIVVLGVPLVCHQYLTLKEWRTTMLAGVMVLAAVGASRVIRPGIGLRPAPDMRSDVSLAGTRLELSPASVQRTVSGSSVDYSAEVVAVGHPRHVRLRLVGWHARLLLPGTTLAVDDQLSVDNVFPPSDGRWSSEPIRASLQAALGDARLPDAPSRIRTPTRISVMRVPEAHDRHFAGQRAVLSATATYDVVTYVRQGHVRLSPGVRLITPREVFDVHAVTPGSTPVLDLEKHAAYRIWDLQWPWPLVLTNRSTQQAFLLDHVSGRRMTPASFPILGWQTQYGRGVVQLVSDPRERPAKGLDAVWLSNAELLSLSTVRLGRIQLAAQTQIELGQPR